MPFPIDLSAYRPVALDPARAELTADERAQLETNIQLCRDAIIFYTAVACAKVNGSRTCSLILPSRSTTSRSSIP